METPKVTKVHDDGSLEAWVNFDRIPIKKKDRNLVTMEQTLLERDGFKVTIEEQENRFRLYDKSEHSIFGDKPIFETTDFKPGTMHSIDSDASVGSLLTFWGCMVGDVEDSYFDNYTERQLDWRDQRAEELGNISVEIEKALNKPGSSGEALILDLFDDGTLDTVISVFDCMTGKTREKRFSDIERDGNGDITIAGWVGIREQIGDDTQGD